MYLKKSLVFISFLLLFACTEKKKESKSIPVEEPAVELTDTTEVVEEAYVEPEDVLIYTVQIGAYSEENTTLENSVDNIISVEEDGLIKYRLGNFSTYKAVNELKEVLLKDYPDAFIVPIYDGERIGIEAALRISDESVN